MKESIIYSNINKCWLVVSFSEHEDVGEGDIIDGFENLEQAQIDYPKAKVERDNIWD